MTADRETRPLLSVHGLVTELATSRGPVRAVDGVSFDIASGETVGIVGESGSGKSMTALTLMGLLPPNGRVAAGTVRLEGTDLASVSAGARAELSRTRMAMVFQEAGVCLNPVLPIGRQIAEAVGARGRLDRAMTARVLDALRAVKIRTPERILRSYPHELSGGMQQRVVIAAAIIRRPQLIIADEPTTALDATVQSEILALLNDLRATLGMALIMISHDLAVIAQTCDLVLVMYAGQIVESGPVAQVFATPRHPYTQALMRSLLDPWSAANTVVPLEGSPPDLSHPPLGCRFHPRCSRRREICCEAAPPVVVVGDQSSRCHFSAEGAS